jgi:signal transduction histidine kinase
MSKKNSLKSDDTSLHLTRRQIFLVQLTLLVLLVMTLSTFTTSQVASKYGKILTEAETASASIILAQRDSLEYTGQIQHWVSGHSLRSEVESAGALLAKRLNTFDSRGVRIRSLVDPSFLQALKASDAVIQKSPQGLLPPQLRATTGAEIAPIVGNIVNSAAELVIFFQKAIDAKLRLVTSQRAKITMRNLLLRYLLLILTWILVIWVSITFAARYKSIQDSIDSQLDDFAISRAELEAAKVAVAKFRILDDEKDEFISNINHELRTPLTSIVGYLGLVSDLTDEKSSPQTANFLKIVDRNLLLLLDLVENMLTISKLEASTTSQIYSRITLNEIIADAIFVLQPSLDAAAISIEFAADNSLDDSSVAGNKGQISQVFINLIENSLKFSPRNSKIHIGTSTVFGESGTKCVRVSVSDQGIGIPSDDIVRLFNRFFRSQNAIDGQIPGTGLGLAIVKRIIEQHGGRISIESELNQGTTVHLELPVFVSGTDQLVLERRLPVLEKAIESVTKAPLDQLRAIAHEMGGALGFYTFENEGAELIDFSHWLTASPDLTQDEIINKRDKILVSLRTSLLKIELGVSN